MLKDGGMGSGLRHGWASSAMWSGCALVASGALAVACSAGTGAGGSPVVATPSSDAGHGSDSSTKGGGIQGGSPDGGRNGDAGDAGNTSSVPAQDTGVGKAALDGGNDGTNGATVLGNCAPHGAPCGVVGSKCCVDTCSNGACGGKLGEGEPCSPDAGPACDDLLLCTSGVCGTNACVPDGKYCGGDAGGVCCNDDCNGVTCGGR